MSPADMKAAIVVLVVLIVVLTLDHVIRRRSG